MNDDDARREAVLAHSRDLVARCAATLATPRPAPEDRWQPPVPEPQRRQPSPPPLPPAAEPSAGWQRWIRALVDKRLRLATDGLEAGVAQFIGDQRHVAGLRHHESERRLAEAEARLDALEHRLTLATEDAPALRLVSGGQP